MKGVVFMEIWKAIRGFEGLYEVSNLGRVRRDGRVLKPHYRKRDGYAEVTLSKNNIPVCRKVHHLVAAAFLSKPCGLVEINHKDENRQNNAAENLEWRSHKENCNYGKRNRRIAQQHSRVVEQLLAGSVVKEWPSASAAGRSGYTKCSIIQCCNGNAQSHKGYQWRWKQSA